MLLLTPGSSAQPGCCRRCLTIGFRDSRPKPGAASLLAGRTAITGEVRLHQHWVPEDCSGHKRLQTGFSVEGGAVAGRVSCFLPGIHQGLQGAGASASDVGRALSNILRFLAQANISPDGGRSLWLLLHGSSLGQLSLTSCCARWQSWQSCLTELHAALSLFTV